MGLFGKRPFNPYAMGADPMMAPGGGIGGGQPGMPMDPAMMGLDTQIAEDPYAGQRPAKPGFFGKGGGWKNALGHGLDALAEQFGGTGQYGKGLQRQEDLQHEEALLRLRGELEGNQQQVVNLGNGGAGTWSQNGGFNVVREPTPDAPKPTQLQQQIEYIRSLNPNMTDAQAADLAQQNMRSFQYSPQAIAAQGQIAEGRAAASERHRAPPRPTAPRYEYRTGPNGQVQRKRIG